MVDDEYFISENESLYRGLSSSKVPLWKRNLDRFKKALSGYSSIEQYDANLRRLLREGDDKDHSPPSCINGLL